MGDFAMLEFLFGMAAGAVVCVGVLATAAFLAVRELTGQKKEEPVSGLLDADHSNN